MTQNVKPGWVLLSALVIRADAVCEQKHPEIPLVLECPQDFQWVQEACLSPSFYLAEEAFDGFGRYFDFEVPKMTWNCFDENSRTKTRMDFDAQGQLNYAEIEDPSTGEIGLKLNFIVFIFLMKTWSQLSC